ncbi:armadillo-type protein [Kockovaella imperatae]|uniref:Armadillo-type protein n=1 Tax=Kockovaella imperatae TaxID=4999 RepID=A0A1Y1UCR4_9TREE|nr:armadillo-type protein [Kockovaella imperatae]ORX35296.1 armadillo-type protein [Kockovaella imperatae]
MGKSQTKKKTRESRHNPMRVPDAHLGSGKSQMGVDQSKEKQMLPILRKLSSAEYADRTWACAAISNLIQNDAATRRLFQGNNVVGALIERLTDGVDEVIVEASGALRNLAIDGGHELCAEMFNKGIMSHLSVLISKCTNTINTILTSPAPATNLSETDYQARKHLLALSENVLYLVWSLAEANHKTLAAINGANVEELLFLALKGRQVLGTGVALAAAQATYSLSQENPEFQRKVVRNSAAIQTLVEIVSAPHDQNTKSQRKGKGKASEATREAEDGKALLLRVLIAGSLRNIVGPSSDPALKEDLKTLTNETILPLVNGLLDIDLENVVRQVMQLASDVASGDPTVKTTNGASTDHRSPSEITLEAIERSLMTVVVGLEILTAICAGVEDVDESEVEEANGASAGSEDEGDDDEEMEDGGENDGNDEDDLFDKSRDITMNGSGPPSTSISTSVTLSHLISTLKLPQRLTMLSTLTQLSLPPSTAQPSPHPPTTSALSVLHLRALEALNNLLLTSVAAISAGQGSSSQLATIVPLAKIWASIFRNVDLIKSEPESLGRKGQEMRLEILEMCIGCLWGTASLSPDALNVSPGQESTLVDAVSVLRSESARTRAIEILASLASRPSVSIEENKSIGNWLVGLLDTDLDPEMLVAVLNAIIDIYADEQREYDAPIFVAQDYLSILAGAMGTVRSKVKSIDRRKQLRLRARAEEASDNLAAFVKYRKTLTR